MPATSNTRAILNTLIALGCALGMSACDKGDDKESKPKSADADKKDGDEKDRDEEDGDKDDGGKDDGGKDDGGKEADGGKDDGGKGADAEAAELAAVRAELAAAKEELAAVKELDAKAAEQLDDPVTEEDKVAHEEKLPEGEKGPVSVAGVHFQSEEMYGDRGLMFEVGADVTVNEVKDGGVYVKASCVMGDEVYVNVATISNKHGDLGKMKAEETKKLSSHLFHMGLPELPSRCQLAFDYGGQAFSTRLADYCWDGKAVTEGACADPVKAVKKGEGKVVPFDFAVKSAKAMGSDKGAVALNVVYGARFNEHIEKAPHLRTKTACKVGDDIWVEVAPNFPHVKPFSMEPGEATLVHHNQFFSNALPGEPEACNIEVYLDGGWGKEDTKLGEVCAKVGKVSEGKCDFKPDAPIEHEELASDSIEVVQVAFEWGKDYRDEKKVVLNARLAATVKKGIKERAQLIGQTTCGKTPDEEHRIGPDLELIGPGETVSIRFSSYRSAALDKPSGKCQLTVSAKPFMGSGGQVELAKFCLKGAKIKKGKCKGKGKPADVGTWVRFPAEDGK